MPVSTLSRTPSSPPRAEHRGRLWRAVFALAVIVAALVSALSTPVRLGLDLRGGTQIVLETRDTGTVVADAESTDRVVEVLRKRVDALGVSEPTLARSGDRRIIVELPGVQDPREAAETIGRTAQLAFHPVIGTSTADEGPAGGLLIADESGQLLSLGPPAVTGDLCCQRGGRIGSPAGRGLVRHGGLRRRRGRAVAGPHQQCRVRRTRGGGPPGGDRVGLRDHLLTPGGSVGGLRGRHPGGSTQITGQFSVDEAKELAALIRGGRCR